MVQRSSTGSTGRPRGHSPPRRKTMSFKVKAEKPQPKKANLKQATYPVYKLKWEKLKAFLTKRFPNHEFKERRVNGDHYLFEIPESLKSADREMIEKERDGQGQAEPPRRADSPEPM